MGDITAIDEVAEPTPFQMNSHIYFLTEDWDAVNLTGRELWRVFQDEFDGWTVQRWERVPDRTRKYLRAFLSSNGVYVDNTNTPLPAKLEAIAKRTTFHAWTIDEINYAMDKSTAFQQRMEDPKFARDIQELPRWMPTVSAALANVTTPPTNVPAAPAIVPTDPATIPTKSQVFPTTQTLPLTTPVFQQPPQTTPVPEQQTPAFQRTTQLPLAPRQQDPTPQTTPARETTRETTPAVKQDLQTPSTWLQPPEERSYAPQGNSRPLTDLAKLYNNEMNGPRDYDTMVAKIRGYFENEEQRHRYLTAWRDARLINIQVEHPDKTKSECLELLINRLALIQRARGQDGSL
ncbi:hypothetical protein N0V88_007151 [Collariella sp. IMI 366227]|nr:hypothetical protein N0V88_007151 [Collariella sp. IMI 366227]